MKQILCIAALVLFASLAAVAAADYKTKWIDVIKVPTFDGFTLRADAFIPVPKTSGEKFPVIIFPNSWGCPQIEYIVRALKLAEHGYVAMEYETRGWYTSTGEIDVAGPLDRKDGSTIIDYVQSQAAAWNADMTNVAFMGISYGAGISLMMAGVDSRVKTAVALSGWNNMTDLFDGNQSPNFDEVESLIHHVGKNGKLSPEILKVAQYLKTHTNMSEVYRFGNNRSPQNYLDYFNTHNTPLFMSSNYMDRLFRPQYMVDFFNALTTSNKFLLQNQGMHAEPEAVGIVLSKSYIWTKAKMWLDHYLKGIPTGITTEPKVHMQVGPSMADQTYLAFNSTYTSASVGGHNTRYFFGHRDTKPYGSLRVGAQPDYFDKIVFDKTPGLTSGKKEDKDESIGLPFNTNFAAAKRHASIVYTTDPLAENSILCGTPKVHLKVGATEANWQVYGFLYDIDAEVTPNTGLLLSESWFSNWAPSDNKIAEFRFHSVCRNVEAGHRIAIGFVLYNELYLPASETVTVSFEYGEAHVDIPFVAPQN